MEKREQIEDEEKEERVTQLSPLKEEEKEKRDGEALKRRDVHSPCALHGCLEISEIKKEQRRGPHNPPGGKFSPKQTNVPDASTGDEPSVSLEGDHHATLFHTTKSEADYDIMAFYLPCEGTTLKSLATAIGTK